MKCRPVFWRSELPTACRNQRISSRVRDSKHALRFHRQPYVFRSSIRRDCFLLLCPEPRYVELFGHFPFGHLSFSTILRSCRLADVFLLIASVLLASSFSSCQETDRWSTSVLRINCFLFFFFQPFFSTLKSVLYLCQITTLKLMNSVCPFGV